jgi:hypothetical protein
VTGPTIWTKRHYAFNSNLEERIGVGDRAPNMDKEVLVVGVWIALVLDIGGELHHAELLRGDAPSLPRGAARLRAHAHP